MKAISRETPNTAFFHTHARTRAQCRRVLADPESPLPSDMAASDLESGSVAAKFPGCAGSLVRHRRVQQRSSQQPLRSGGVGGGLTPSCLGGYWSLTGPGKSQVCPQRARVHSTGSLASLENPSSTSVAHSRVASAVRLLAQEGVLLPHPHPHPHPLPPPSPVCKQLVDVVL